MSKLLTIEMVRKNVKFQHFNKGMTMGSVQRLCADDSRWIFDFDVYLPTKGINLQRGLVWTLFQKQELIVSILKGISLPPISVVEFEPAKGSNAKTYQIIDGKQRLNTAISYVKGEFPILWNGVEYYYNDLHDFLKSAVGGYWLRWDIAYHYDDTPITDQMKIDWFELLNFSGTPQDVEHMNKLKGLAVDAAKIEKG